MTAPGSLRISVAVQITASHRCISGRGMNKHGMGLTITQVLGCFGTEPARRGEFPAGVNADGPGRGPVLAPE